MLKSIAQLFCPSSRKLADAAASKIATGFNSIDEGKREKLAKYSAYAKRIAEYQAKLDEIVADGKIDADEEARIAAALEPMWNQRKSLPSALEMAALWIICSTLPALGLILYLRDD